MRKVFIQLNSYWTLVLAGCIVAGAMSCHPRPAANEKRYDLKGKVISVNKTEKTATIDHEEIAGYMAAMTMEFVIKRDTDLETLKPGNVITGTFVVTDEESWVEITTSTDGPPSLTSTAEVPGEPKPGDAVTDFTLINQDGKRIRLSHYRGQAVALTFIYTRCPDPNQCALMSTNFATIDRELQKDPAIYKKTHLLSISFDPEFDTPKVLRSYGGGHTGRYSDETFTHWDFATGTKGEVKAIAEYFGLRYFTDPESGKEKVVHSLRTAIIGADGKLFKLYRGNEWKPGEVIRDLSELARSAN